MSKDEHPFGPRLYEDPRALKVLTSIIIVVAITAPYLIMTNSGLMQNILTNRYDNIDFDELDTQTTTVDFGVVTTGGAYYYYWGNAFSRTIGSSVTIVESSNEDYEFLVYVPVVRYTPNNDSKTTVYVFLEGTADDMTNNGVCGGRVEFLTTDYAFPGSVTTVNTEVTLMYAEYDYVPDNTEIVDGTFEYQYDEQDHTEEVIGSTGTFTTDTDQTDDWTLQLEINYEVDDNDALANNTLIPIYFNAFLLKSTSDNPLLDFNIYDVQDAAILAIGATLFIVLMYSNNVFNTREGFSYATGKVRERREAFREYRANRRGA